MQQQAKKLGYLPFIEGMRAIAIILVLAAHSDVPYLSGGVIGVDIFFVISGYLISALLMIELSNTGRLDLLGFYARRLRRLFPALLLALAATGLLAELLIPRNGQPAAALAGASASVWLSNLYFAFIDTDYFGTDENGNPFLHTWSLGVEEQFYLLWPVLIHLVISRTRGVESIRRLTLFLVGVLTVSLIGFLSLSRTQYSTHVYFLMPTRAWQFSLGALVWLTQCRGLLVSARFPTATGLIGLLSILFATISFDGHASLPELRSLAATVGAALLMASGTSRSDSALAYVLSGRLMQSIGRVSYGWYLWHWPLLVFGQLYFIDADLSIRLLSVMGAWVLAVVTQEFVEAPLRSNQRLLEEPGKFVLATVCLMVIATAVFLLWHEVGISRISAQTQKDRYMAIKWDTPVLYAQDCDDWYRSAELKICRFGNVNGKKTAVIMGDSIGLQWFPAFEALFAERGWLLLVITKSSCPMVDEPVFYPRIKRYFTECAEWRDKAVESIRTIRPDILLLGSGANYGFDENQWLSGTSRLLDRLSTSAKHLYLIRSTPTLPFNGPDCLARLVETNDLPVGKRCEASSDDKRDNEVWGWLSRAAMGYSNTGLIDLNGFVCPNGVCKAERDGFFIYRDSLHLTAKFAESLKRPLGEMIAESLAR